MDFKRWYRCVSWLCLELNGETISEIHAYDADAIDGDGTGAVVNVTSDGFELTTTFSNTLLVVATAVVGVAIIGGVAFFIIKRKA